MAGAKSLEELATVEYWDTRYSKPNVVQTYEWFKGYDNIRLREFFTKHLPQSSSELRILHLGCGNSVRGFPLVEADFLQHHRHES